MLKSEYSPLAIV